MIYEEFDWEMGRDYLRSNVTAVIYGLPMDERSSYFYQEWSSWNTTFIMLNASADCNSIDVRIEKNREIVFEKNMELMSGLRYILGVLRKDLEIVCIDLSSLKNVVSMFLAKIFISEIKPRRLFATYAEPIEYKNETDLEEYNLSVEFLGYRSVPSFAMRLRKTERRLVAFLGFEGSRLIRLSEYLDNILCVTPVIGFPSYKPGWQIKSLINSMRAISNAGALCDIEKCSADSVFGAYELLMKLAPTKVDESYVLAPLGTRPHSFACGIYATLHPGTHIVYDYPIEVNNRTAGILRTRCYHLSNFIMS